MRPLISLICFLALITGTASANERLFDPPNELFGRISPDGNRLAVVGRVGEDFQLDAIEFETSERHTFFSTATLGSGEYTISAMEWVDNDSLVLLIVELTEGVAKLSDTRNKRHYIVVDAIPGAPKVRYIKTRGAMIDALPAEENAILFARAGSTSIVYRIDTSELYEWGKRIPKTAPVDGGQFSHSARVAEVDGFVLRWLTTAAGFVRVALRVNEDGVALMIRDQDGDEWEVEKSWEDEKRRKSKRRKRSGKSDKADESDEEKDRLYVPVALIEDSRDFVVLGEDEDGREAVYRYNYATATKTLIYSHPTAEMVSAGLSADSSTVLYASYFEDGVVKYHYVEGAYREVADEISAIYPQYNAAIGATDLDESRFMVFLRAPTQPGRAFIYERESGRLEQLFEVMPWLDEETLAPSIAADVVSDGLEIEYFLTVPKADGKVPLVVYPHGGPWGVGDSRRFSPVVQYLASRGTAVLQVNYRGSSGYGEDFIEQGVGEFGRRMLDDIEAALDEAVKNPAIDASRICAIGESYGGYAALTLVIRAPDRFRCVASYAGVTDLGLLLGSYDSENADRLMTLLAGETSDRDTEYETLRQLSPLYNAEHLSIPVLIAHGDDDRRVDIEHSYRMVARLRNLGKDFEWHELVDTRHRFVKPADALAYYQLLGNFLERHLVTP